MGLCSMHALIQVLWGMVLFTMQIHKQMQIQIQLDNQPQPQWFAAHTDLQHQQMPSNTIWCRRGMSAPLPLICSCRSKYKFINNKWTHTVGSNLHSASDHCHCNYHISWGKSAPPPLICCYLSKYKYINTNDLQVVTLTATTTTYQWYQATIL